VTLTERIFFSPLGRINRVTGGHVWLFLHPDRRWCVRRSRQSRRKLFVRLGRLEALVQL
jgi:hypothetical protein